MNKRLLFAGLLAVASFSSGVKAADPADVSMADRLKGFGLYVASHVKDALDFPANALFADGSYIASKSHEKVAFAARLGLTGYVGYTVSQNQKVKELWGKVTACCKKRK